MVKDGTYVKKPIACTDAERREFERLVRQGFAGSDEGLPGRIRDAQWLAFHYAADDTLAAIAGLKAPGEQYRDEVFQQSAGGVRPVDHELELGWVFVLPTHRGNRIGARLCRMLLAREPESGVFATTRPDNDVMIKILGALGFSQTGKPYPHARRNEDLVLFLRSAPVEGTGCHKGGIHAKGRIHPRSK